jgi:hypothetical protein
MIYLAIWTVWAILTGGVIFLAYWLYDNNSSRTSGSELLAVIIITAIVCFFLIGLAYVITYNVYTAQHIAEKML